MCRICVASIQEFCVEWSSIPCVMNGWGYKDHSSDFLRITPGSLYHTSQHLQSWSWARTLGWGSKINWLWNFPLISAAPGYPVDKARNSLFSNSVARKKCSLDFHSPNPLICPGNYILQGTLSFLKFVLDGRKGSGLSIWWVPVFSYSICNQLPSPPLRKWAQSTLTSIVVEQNLWEWDGGTWKRMLAYEFLLLSHSKRKQQL